MLIGHYVVHTNNFDETVEALKGSKFDMMFLDHDLEDIKDKVERTGVTVVGEILAMPADKFPDDVIVHSWNPDGAQNMMNLLKSVHIKARYRPFGAWVR